MKLAVGQTLASAVDATTVIVTRAPDDEVSVTCGGVEMAAPGATVADATADPDQQSGTLLGKRYVDDAATIELLVTKPGQGTLALGGQPLVVQGAKPLPASD
ncbi:hypothetical protein [Nocardioides sp.]|uniref:hypothetical protein n=1 Tax=Nocardioides sp. TaxID=35761 RepID=UPI0039E4BE92